MTRRERPILFSGPMVRAILAGLKTQTRRPICSKSWVWLDPGVEDDGARALAMCPYGKPGDRLWVRETWGFDAKVSTDSHETWLRERNSSWVVYRADEGSNAASWRPSIFMPRWACRLELEVANVRSMRLQQITEDDARAEGVDILGSGDCDECRGSGQFFLDGQAQPCVCSEESEPSGPRLLFRELWDRLNRKRAPWASNPWVWAISFRRAT